MFCYYPCTYIYFTLLLIVLLLGILALLILNIEDSLFLKNYSDKRLTLLWIHILVFSYKCIKRSFHSLISYSVISWVKINIFPYLLSYLFIFVIHSLFMPTHINIYSHRYLLFSAYYLARIKNSVSEKRNISCRGTAILSFT